MKKRMVSKVGLGSDSKSQKRCPKLVLDSPWPWKAE